jgi:hypothetical protein
LVVKVEAVVVDIITCRNVLAEEVAVEEWRKRLGLEMESWKVIELGLELKNQASCSSCDLLLSHASKVPALVPHYLIQCLRRFESSMMALAVPDCRRLQLVRVVPRTGVEVIVLRLRGVVRRPLPTTTKKTRRTRPSLQSPR